MRTRGINWAHALSISRTALILAASASLHAAELHVAPTGNDANPGTQQEPLHTLQAALNRLQAGDTGVVHAGTYRESVEFNKPGAAGAPIRLQAAVGEKAVIDGTEPLKLQWEKYRGNIYKAATPARFRQLFFDGAMMFEARWPNMASVEDLWKESRWAVAGRGSEYGKVVDPKLAAMGIDMTGATVVLNVYHQFYTWTRTVQAHKAGSNSFTYEKNLKGVGDKLEAKKKNENNETLNFSDNRYYLIGKLELLDAPGEWFLDTQSGTLYFYAPGGVNPTGHTLVVKQRDYGIWARQQHHLQIDGLTFFGCGIMLADCDDCRLENSSILYSSCTEQERLNIPKGGKKRGRMPGGSDAPSEADRATLDLESLHPTITGNRNVICNNLFAYGSQTGLYVDGADDVIENNIFHDFGWLSSLGHVALCFSKVMGKGGGALGRNGLIRYNTLYNTGGPILHFQGQNIRVEYNDLHHGMRAAFGGNKDVAMLYTGGEVSGSRVARNWVHDSAGGSTKNVWGNGIGIRGDDNTIGLTMERNVVWNVGSCSIMMKNVANPTPEQANAVINNTTFDNSTMLLGKNKVDVILAVSAPNENQYSRLMNNAANMMHKAWGQKPLAKNPLFSHNVVTAKLPLMDPKNFDFRPTAGSRLIDAGQIVPGHPGEFVGKAPDIGAYEAGATEYWVPGYRTAAASRPIVPDQAKGVRLNADLIWLQGYQSMLSDVYWGTSKTAVQSANRHSKEFKGTRKGNIFSPGMLAGGTEYFWRVDAVGADDKTVKGAVWSFRTK